MAGRRALALAAALAGALIGLLRFKPEGESDLGWHLAQGRQLIEGGWQRENGLSWAAPHQAWVNTSALFDVACAAAAAALPGALGPQLLTALLLLLTALALGLCGLELTRPSAPAGEQPAAAALGALVCPLAVLLLWPRATPRPHVASWAVLAWTLWLSLRARRPGAEWPGLRVVALGVVALGAWRHPGAAFAAALLGIFALEAFARTRRPAELWMLAAAPAVLLLNPGGAFSLLHLLRHWSVQETVRIAEFEPPGLRDQPAFFVLLPIALAGLWSKRREEPALLAATLLFGLLGLRAHRMTYEARVVALPALALVLGSLQARAGTRAAALGWLLAAVAALAPHQGLARLLTRPVVDPRWDEHRLPVRAARVLDAWQVTGPGFNGLSDGGYLAWARPAVPIFVDARLHAYPAALWRALEEAEETPARFQAFARAQGCEWAIATRSFERLGGYQRLDAPDWALVYWDDLSEVFLRRDVARFAPLIDSFEYKRFRPYRSVIGAVERLPREELPSLDAEVARFLETTPGDLIAGVAACASATRQARPRVPTLCAAVAAAAAQQGRADVLRLVERAQALR